MRALGHVEIKFKFITINLSMFDFGQLEPFKK